MSISRKLTIRAESWPLKQRFSIARGSRISADVLAVELKCGDAVGRGEAVPYRRYNESMETVTAAVESIQTALEAGLSRTELLDALLPGAARNAIDCAFAQALNNRFFGRLTQNNLLFRLTDSISTVGRLCPPCYT